MIRGTRVRFVGPDRGGDHWPRRGELGTVDTVQPQADIVIVRFDRHCAGADIPPSKDGTRAAYRSTDHRCQIYPEELAVIG